MNRNRRPARIAKGASRTLRVTFNLVAPHEMTRRTTVCLPLKRSDNPRKETEAEVWGLIAKAKDSATTATRRALYQFHEVSEEVTRG